MGDFIKILVRNKKKKEKKKGMGQTFCKGSMGDVGP